MWKVEVYIPGISNTSVYKDIAADINKYSEPSSQNIIQG